MKNKSALNYILSLVHMQKILKIKRKNDMGTWHKLQAIIKKPIKTIINIYGDKTIKD